MRRIHQEEEEEALMGWTACAPSDRFFALIAANEVSEGGCPVYNVDKGGMGKG